MTAVKCVRLDLPAATVVKHAINSPNLPAMTGTSFKGVRAPSQALRRDSVGLDNVFFSMKAYYPTAGQSNRPNLTLSKHNAYENDRVQAMGGET